MVISGCLGFRSKSQAADKRLDSGPSPSPPARGRCSDPIAGQACPVFLHLSCIPDPCIPPPIQSTTHSPHLLICLSAHPASLPVSELPTSHSFYPQPSSFLLHFPNLSFRSQLRQNIPHEVFSDPQVQGKVCHPSTPTVLVFCFKWHSSQLFHSCFQFPSSLRGLAILQHLG